MTAGPLRLLLAGDAMLGRGVDEAIARHGVDWPLAALRQYGKQRRRLAHGGSGAA